MKKLGSIFLVVMVLLTGRFLVFQDTAGSTGIELKITSHPPKFYPHHRTIMDFLPVYDPDSKTHVDLRYRDISSVDLKGRMTDLQHATFDSLTEWPETLPANFNPDRIMKIGKNPGLGVRELHKKGITGKGVGIAIIDLSMLVEHVEYKDRLQCYEEINYPGGPAVMHGTSVASLAVGKSVGVAPEADLYFFASLQGEFSGNHFKYDYTRTVEVIDRIIEINTYLPEDKKIRVLSISSGWDKDKKGYKEIMEAVARLKKQGIFVISSSLHNTYGYYFDGLDRGFYDNPDKFYSYRPGWSWAENFYQNKKKYYSEIKKDKDISRDEILLVPMDSRTTASPTGKKDYTFHSDGGLSWAIPYLAGLYALAYQVDPDITPDEFWHEALNTGEVIEFTKNDKKYKLGRIVNPVKLIERIQK